jgi:hypothetical protein
MQTTRMTGSMRRSLEARLLDLEMRVSVLERPREGEDSLDETALHFHLSRERDRIADALANATLIDDDPYDTEAIEIGDMVTVRAMGGGAEEQYILVTRRLGPGPDWIGRQRCRHWARLCSGEVRGTRWSCRRPEGRACIRSLTLSVMSMSTTSKVQRIALLTALPTRAKRASFSQTLFRQTRGSVNELA